jgi:hypothetical protein
MPFREFVERVKNEATFSKAEAKEFWLATLILGLVYSWNGWGTVEFDFWVGAANFLFAFLIAASTLYIHHFGQRLWGTHKGYHVQHKVWWYGVGAAFIITLLSGGNVFVLAVSGTFVTIDITHRLGRYKYGPNVKDFAMIALMGPLANIIVAGFFKSLQPWLPLPELIDQFFVFSLAFAAWSLLPLPPLDGSRILFGSRLLYAWVVGAVVGYVLLIQLFNVFSWIWALVLGAFTWFLFYLFLEKSWESH